MTSTSRTSTSDTSPLGRAEKSAGNPTGSAGRLRTNGERLGIWGGFTFILADFFRFWAQTYGELKGKRGLSIQDFLVSCVFLWRIYGFLRGFFPSFGI